MSEFKAGDEIQFDANAVREADRIDKEQYGGTRGYAEGIISKGGLESGGVIERNDYSDEAPFQIKLPNGSKCWAEEEWLKAPDKFQPGDKVDWIKADKYWRGVEVFERKDFTPWGTDQADKIIEGYRVWGPLPGGTAPGLIAASELVLHQEQEPEPAPDKFQPGQIVDWINSDSSQRANGFWDGSTIVERLTSGTFEGEYRVRNSAGDEGIIDGDQLVLTTSQEDDYDEWKANDSAEYYHSGDDSADSPDEAPSFEEGWETLYGVLPPKTRGQADYQIHMIPNVKDPAAPTMEELNQGIDVSAHITDISGFSTTFTLGEWQEPEEDGVNAPSHYSEGVPGDFEVIDVIHAQGWEDNWYMGNAVKYLLRAQYKGNYAQDLRKVVKMIEWELSRTENSDG